MNLVDHRRSYSHRPPFQVPCLFTCQGATAGRAVGLREGGASAPKMGDPSQWKNDILQCIRPLVTPRRIAPPIRVALLCSSSVLVPNSQQSVLVISGSKRKIGRTPAKPPARPSKSHCDPPHPGPAEDPPRPFERAARPKSRGSGGFLGYSSPLWKETGLSSCPPSCPPAASTASSCRRCLRPHRTERLRLCSLARFPRFVVVRGLMLAAGLR